MTKEKSFTDILEYEQRRPKKGDRLLKPTDNRDRGASFSNESVTKHVFAWSGFMDAADTLVDQVTNGTLDQNFVIYPILFNYRHGLELDLKWIIKMYGPHSHQDLSLDTDTHDLWALWSVCKKIIVEISPVRRQINCYQ